MSSVDFKHPSQPQPLVLVADDDPFMRLQLRRAMEEEGYQVVEVTNGEQCLADYQRLHPDIVLLDAVMPVMDGFTCCANLQMLVESNRTPILMITGLEDAESVAQAFAAGATDYITKPIHWAVLRQRVRRLLYQNQLYRELESTNQLLQKLVSIDGLTHLANRRRFDEYFAQEWQRMTREQAPISLILCDIDFFKLYNDTYGHQAGDECLRQVAQALESSVKRPADLAARYGGEEFVIVLPNTHALGGASVAADIQERVQLLKIPHASSTISPIVTLSLGIATVTPWHKVSPEILLNTADKALYQAKAAGRNQYCVQQLRSPNNNPNF
jgi:diguanylate cyclase (GGDEF)-like protein